MIRILAFFKFFISFLLIISFLGAGIFLTIQEDRSDVLVVAISLLLILFFAAVYSYYLIKTGIWNLKNKTYAPDFLLIAGLVIHFICTVSLFVYSQNLFPSKKASDNLLFTTLPFFIAGMAIGIYDTGAFYKNRKAKRSA